MDIESDGSERWEDFFGSSTDLGSSLLGYYDSLATKVSDDQTNGNCQTPISESLPIATTTLTITNTTSDRQSKVPEASENAETIGTGKSFQSGSVKFKTTCHSTLRPIKPTPDHPRLGNKFWNLSSNVQRILSNTESSVESTGLDSGRPRLPPTPFHRNHSHSASFNSLRSITVATATARHTFKHLPLSKNIAKLSQVSSDSEEIPEPEPAKLPDSNGNCDSKFSFIQQRIRSLTSALIDGEEEKTPKVTSQEDNSEQPVLRNPLKPMATSQPPSEEQNDAFVENCDESENRNTIVEAHNPYLNLVSVETDCYQADQEESRRQLTYARVQLLNGGRGSRALPRSPRLPRSGPNRGLHTSPSTSTSTPSLDTNSSASLSSSKASLIQTPVTPVLNTRPLSASSICSYSSSSSSGSDTLHLVNGKCLGAPSYQASVESLADQSECEQSASANTSGLTMCERAVMEIVDSERSYVEDLGQIIKGYLHDWKERACLKVDKLEILFSNIQEVWEFNTRLLNRLNETKGDPVKISNCFIDLHDEFDCYTTYCTRYPEAIALLTSLLQATHTNSLLIHTQKMLNHNLPLGSYLLKPVQRILKYHLLLDNLRKHCDDSQVTHAHELMKNVAHNIDQVKRKLEQLSRVKELAGILDGWLGPDLSVLGELRQEGVLTEHGKPRVVLLFQTMLIITKPKEDKRLLFRAYIPCKNLMLVEHLPGEPNSFNVIPYNDPKGQIKLSARNRDQKRLWTQQIKKAMLEHFDIPKRAKELVLQLGDEDDRIVDKNASWKWPTNHPSTPEYLERRQQFRRSEMRMRTKKLRKTTSSTISLDGISQKDVRQPTFQSYSDPSQQKQPPVDGTEVTAHGESANTPCKCDAVKKELEQKQTTTRSRSETRVPEEKKLYKLSDEEVFAKAMQERNRFATHGRRKAKENLSDVKTYNSTTIPKRIANIRKTRSKTLTGNSTFYMDLSFAEGSSDAAVSKIVESTDNLSLKPDCATTSAEPSSGDAKIANENEPDGSKNDSEIISQLVLEKNEFRKINKAPKKKSFDSMRSGSCQDEEPVAGVDRKEDMPAPQLPITSPPEEEEEEEEPEEAFRKVDELNKSLLTQLSEIQCDLPSPEPIYESLLRNVHVPYKYAPPLTRSVSQQYGKALENLHAIGSSKKSRPDSDYVTLTYSDNVLVNIDGHSVEPKSAITQLRNSDTNINYHHPWQNADDTGSIQETRSEIVNIASDEPDKLLERQGSLSIKSPKSLLQRFKSRSPSTGSFDSNLHQRKISCTDEVAPIYKQGSLDLGSRIANMDYVDPRTLFPLPSSQQPNILVNRGSVKPTTTAVLEQRDSIFSLTSSNDSVCGPSNELEDELCGFYEKCVEECLENEDFRDSAVYSGDDNDRRADIDDQVVYESIGDLGRLLRPPSQVVRSSSSASSSSCGPPPVPVKPAYLEQRKAIQLKKKLSTIAPEAPVTASCPPSKGWVLQQVKRFQ